MKKSQKLIPGHKFVPGSNFGSLRQLGASQTEKMGMTMPRQVLPGTTYLFTRRCIDRRFLLRPDSVVCAIMGYVLALAAAKHRIQIHAICVMSNHYHIVLTDRFGELPEFARLFNRLTALCLARHRDWRGPVWEPGRSYSALPLLTEKAVWDKLCYTLCNPVSAGLVPLVTRWPGLISKFGSLSAGKMRFCKPPLYFKGHAPETRTLKLTKPPALNHHSDDSYEETLRRLVKRRQQMARDEVRRRGLRFLSKAKVLKTRYWKRPTTEERVGDRNPRFAAVSKKGWLEALKDLHAFHVTYRAAYLPWREGDLSVRFPAGTYWVVKYSNARAEPPP